MKQTYIINILLILLTSIFVFTSCASKRYTKKAIKLETLGQYSDAADLFFQALSIDKTNVDAFSGLKRTGQLTLNKKLSQFNLSYNNQNNKEAVYHYQEADNYFEKVKSVGVELNFPSFYKEYYDEVKNIYLEDKYVEAMNHLRAERFSEAEMGFKEILKLQKNYKEAAEKVVVAINEPKYREGLRLMENNKYRKAYYVFDNIIRTAKSYQSSEELKAECLEKGSITLAINKVKNNTKNSNFDNNIHNLIINNVKSVNNPFLKIIDYQYNSSVGIKPPDMILNLELANYMYDKGENKEIEKKGYIKTLTKSVNKETGQAVTNTQYDKVKYYEYSMQRKLNVTIIYQLIDGRTSEVYVSNTKTIQTGDQIRYARYKGDTKNLVPGNWTYQLVKSKDDYINDNNSAVSHLQSLLNSRSTIKDYNTLLNEANQQASMFVSEGVINFINNY